MLAEGLWETGELAEAQSITCKMCLAVAPILKRGHVF